VQVLIDNPIAWILHAAAFAADKHRNQRTGQLWVSLQEGGSLRIRSVPGYRGFTQYYLIDIIIF
jgi:hypothetical protein